jgi:4'-phosphopantetheinyl transferase
MRSRVEELAAEPGRVDAWLVDLDAIPDPLGACALLSPAEHDRAASYLRPLDGTRFAASRAWLRVILSRYLAADAADPSLTPAAAGRPAPVTHRNGTLCYSLSRAGGRCLIAIAPSAVGADIERTDDRAGLADLVIGRFTPAEADCLAAGCGGGRLRGFYRHWTAKEAFLKATGIGLAGVRETALACGVMPTIEFAGQPAPGWTVSLLDPAAGYVAAVAGPGPVHLRNASDLLAAYGPASTWPLAAWAQPGGCTRSPRPARGGRRPARVPSPRS